MTLLAVVTTVAAGGVAAVLRWAVSVAFVGHRLPWAVLIVNVLASLVGGSALGLASAGLIGGDLELILLSGVAGGISTFSTWSVETIQLVQKGRWPIALASVAANLVLGIAAAAAGYGAVTSVAP